MAKFAAGTRVPAKLFAVRSRGGLDGFTANIERRNDGKNDS
ncbi:hypothetical protein ACRRQX_004730 [Yersinia enterocolitica]|nr:hypothetical protein [Yersinia enterocolitica]